eukprot:jgi/Bigna1/144523/aug1.88_g19231
MVVLGKYEEKAEILDDRNNIFEELFVDDKPEIVAVGFRWTEGPVWNFKDESLYFSDTVLDNIYRFDTKTNKISIFLYNSGGLDQESGEKQLLVETGSNGLIIDGNENELIIMQHGGRGISRMDMDLGFLVKFASTYPANKGHKGHRLNSPNDGVIYHDVDHTKKKYLFFTDPPYGLINVSQPHDHPDVDARSEINGSYVYSVDLERKNPNITVLKNNGNTTRPNGIDITPDGEFAYISNCCQGHDPYCPRGRGIWWKHKILHNESWEEFGHPTLANSHVPIIINFGRTSGCADGFKVIPGLDDDDDDVPSSPMIIGSCPGGLCILDTRDWKLYEPLLAYLGMPERVSNVAVGGDGYLYITGEGKLWRLKIHEDYRELMITGRYSYIMEQRERDRKRKTKEGGDEKTRDDL